MDKASINGKMEGNMLAIMNMIRKVDLENIIGTMGEFLREHG